jgi:hypothetical protein
MGNEQNWYNCEHGGTFFKNVGAETIPACKCPEVIQTGAYFIVETHSLAPDFGGLERFVALRHAKIFDNLGSEMAKILKIAAPAMGLTCGEIPSIIKLATKDNVPTAREIQKRALAGCKHCKYHTGNNQDGKTE